MEISLGGLLFLALFAFYLWNEHNKQVLGAKRRELEQQREIEKLKSAQNQSITAPPERIHTVETIHEKEKIIYVPYPVQQSPPKPPYQALPSAKTFVQVIFKKNGKKRYDYYLGDNYDVKVGDFVKVYTNDKWSGKNKLKVAKVLYISAPGETSKYANSTILGKAAYPKW